MASSSAFDATAPLRALLASKGVADEVTQWLVDSGCKHVATFANWVDDKKELKASVLDKTPKADDPAQLAYLRQAWREADAVTARGIKRTAEGMATEELDAPLDPDFQQQLETAFRKQYDWPRVLARHVQLHHPSVTSTSVGTSTHILLAFPYHRVTS